MYLGTNVPLHENQDDSASFSLSDDHPPVVLAGIPRWTMVLSPGIDAFGVLCSIGDPATSGKYARHISTTLLHLHSLAHEPDMQSKSTDGASASVYTPDVKPKRPVSSSGPSLLCPPVLFLHARRRVVPLMPRVPPVLAVERGVVLEFRVSLDVFQILGIGRGEFDRGAVYESVTFP
jgi:hypothetical protein